MKKFFLNILRRSTVMIILVIFVLATVYFLARTVVPIRHAVHTIAKMMYMGTFAQIILPDNSVNEEQADVAVSALAQDQVKEISFSEAAAKNIGIDDTCIVKVEVTDFNRAISFPAVITERPGHSTIYVPSSVTGIITKIYHEAGVAVSSGEPLFDIQLNQQEIISGQIEYIALLKAKEINHSEIERLSALGADIVPQKKRELEFQKQKLDVEISNQKKLLEIQGLNDEQIENSLEKKQEIIKSITIHVPLISENDGIVKNHEQTKTILSLDHFNVNIGQNVSIGESLCQLSDLNMLIIKGKVFSNDEKIITKALNEKRNVSAVFGGNGHREIVSGLFLRSIDNRIDENGVIYCYVDLKNESQIRDIAIMDEKSSRSYVEWRYRPGLRCELNVEYDVLPSCIVLPVDAVAQDISETCIFEWVGVEEDKKIWRKKTVHVLYKNKDVVVIANDGSIFPEAKVTTKGASFILAALDAANQKNAGGGGIQHGDHVH